LSAAPPGKPSKDSGGSHEQQYVRQVIALHDKYLNYVSTCFANSSLFHKALKEAFEGFCNRWGLFLCFFVSLFRCFFVCFFLFFFFSFC
jgi:hypothetical protein